MSVDIAEKKWENCVMESQPTRLSKFLERKISKRKIETSGIAGLTFGDLIYDIVRVDQSYIDGVNFSRPSKDLSSIFKIGKQNITLGGQNRFSTLLGIQGNRSKRDNVMENNLRAVVMENSLTVVVMDFFFITVAVMQNFPRRRP